MFELVFYFKYKVRINLSSKLFSLLFFTFSSILAQNFEKLNTQKLKGGYHGFSSFVDYNNDGFLDIFVTGVDFESEFTNAVFYENNGDLSFSESDITNIPRIIYGDYSWGDFDNNKTLDLLYSGTTSGFSEDGITKVYRNSKNGCEFIELPVKLPGISKGSSKWADIDNDGLLDIFLVGFDINDELIIKAYKNNGNDSFTEQPIPTIEKFSGGRGNFTNNKAKWKDLDGDGLQDLIIALSNKLDFSFEVYKNLGDFMFAKQNIGLPKLSSVAMNIGDINNDGLPDLVFTGSPNLENDSGDGTGDFYVFVNNGNMSFANSFTIVDEGVLFNDVELGDINNDGFLDAINYGTGPWGTYPEITKIYNNNGNDTFSNVSHNLPNCRFGGVEFGDFDNDNDLDVLYFGRMRDPYDKEVTYIYTNTFTKKDFPTTILANETCICDNTLIFSVNHDYDSIIWGFDDPATGVLNTSSNKKPSHQFSKEGSYTISATVTKGSVTNKLTKKIDIIGLPTINRPTNVISCDNDTAGIYDFSTLKTKEILNGASLSNFEVHYYLSYDNSKNDQYRLPNPYKSKSLGEKIYVRVQNITNPNCFTLTEFDIIIETPPNIDSIDDFIICDDDYDGFAIFDLTPIESIVINNQVDIITEYYNQLGDIIPKNYLIAYKNSIANSETITLRVTNSKNECFTETKINLVVNTLPIANTLDTLIGCDDNNDGISEYFDTSSIKSDVIGNQTEMMVSFYDSNGNKLPELKNPYTNKVPNKETITVRVKNIDTNCYAEAVLTLKTEHDRKCEQDGDETIDIDYPKFFTPNNDGYNDYWQIIDISKYSNSNIFIFDRFGKILKQISPKDIGWDGSYNGKKMPSNDYWFKINLINGKVFTGHFALKR